MRMIKYKVEIIRVENGYTIRLDNDNHISQVFVNIWDVLEFLKEYFGETK